uniref:Reverse transcriptase domain-containing protein n=1 Tax=Tanacetum cinerariifolium TaxID=118510 RepID=A0A6L2NST1_TANCI|nr:reverse transcriptase domain-containing protein [Tanacetum cinerariifolium]
MVTKLGNEITNFHQRPDESLFEAWEHYKLSIDRCPYHNMLPVTQIDTFFNGLTLRHRDTINAVADGTFMKRRPEECYDLIENMTAHQNYWDTSAQRTTVGHTQNIYTAGAYNQGGLVRGGRRLEELGVRKTKVVTRWGGGCFMAKGFYLVTKMGDGGACGDVLEVLGLSRRWKKVGRVGGLKNQGGGCFMAKGFYLVTKMGDGAACGDVMKVLRNKKYQGSYSNDGGNTMDGVKIIGGVIGSGGGIEEMFPGVVGK